MNSWITNWNKIKISVKQIIKKQPGKDAESQWTKCSCQEIIYKEDLQKNLHVCPKCELHHKISCRDRFNITFDEEIYEILLALRWDGMHYTYKPIEFPENYPNPDEQDRDNIDEMVNEIKKST